MADVEPTSERGLLDLSLPPQFADNRLLYLAYAYGGDGRGRPARDDDRMLQLIPVP
jgi:glucose/arabinose dehydrogenase